MNNIIINDGKQKGKKHEPEEDRPSTQKREEEITSPKSNIEQNE